MNNERILWRTRDHSLTQQLFDGGRLSETEMGMHPEQNQLTRGISILRRYKTETHICCDGFWEFIEESELLHLAQRGVGEEELKKYVSLMASRAEGKSDNITVQMVKAF